LIYRVLNYARRAPQPLANTLSTSPPTAIGEKYVPFAIFCSTKSAETVTYKQESSFPYKDQFLINSVNALNSLGREAKQTPYPQKHQQRLGVILTPLWKNAETACNPGKYCGIPDKPRRLIIK